MDAKTARAKEGVYIQMESEDVLEPAILSFSFFQCTVWARDRRVFVRGEILDVLVLDVNLRERSGCFV